MCGGDVTFVFDLDRFRHGYQDGRLYYRLEIGNGQPAQQLTASELLRMIALPDEQGYYQLEGGDSVTDLEEGVEELLGVLVGYLSGPLYPETSEERCRCEALLSRFPSLDERGG